MLFLLNWLLLLLYTIMMKYNYYSPCYIAISARVHTYMILGAVLHVHACGARSLNFSADGLKLYINHCQVDHACTITSQDIQCDEDIHVYHSNYVM